MNTITRAALAAVLLALAAPATSPIAFAQSEVTQTISGVASWYGAPFHGRTTANGERFNMHDMTAAHKSLPFGSRVRVTNQNNGRNVIVRINDRGPYHGGRIIDLSQAAASQLGMIGPGTARVMVEVLT